MTGQLRSLRGMLVRNTLANWVHYAVAAAAAIALTPFIIGRVGAPVYGLWLLLVQLTGYAGLLDIGMQPAVAKFLARARALGDQQSIRELLVTALALQAGVLGLAFMAVIAYGHWFPRWFDLAGVPPEDARAALFLAGLAAALGLPANLFGAVLKGYRRFDLAAAVGVSAQITRAAATVMTIHAGWTVMGLALSALLGNLAALVVGGFLALREAGWPPLGARHYSWRTLAEMTRFGLYSAVAAAGTYLAYGTDAILIGAMLNTTAVAHFGLAVNVLTVLSGIVGGFAGVLMPLASEAEAKGRTDQNLNHYLLGTRISLLIAVPPAVVFLLAGPALLSAWVGASVGQPAGMLLRILTLAHLPVIANSAGVPIALGAGQQRTVMLVSLCEGLVNLVLSYLLVQEMGLAGVAVGTLIAAVLAHGVAWPLLLAAQLGLTWKRYWAEALRPNVAPTAVAAGGFLLLRYLLPPGVGSLLFTACGIPAVYWCVSALLWFSAGERQGWPDAVLPVTRGGTPGPPEPQEPESWFW